MILKTDGNSILLKEYHIQFQMFPAQEDIHRYPRRIPYNSERRVYADKTGRDFFEGMLYHAAESQS
jgi:ribosome-associated toxin RatA of RatAB toxin-antitoxin module